MAESYIPLYRKYRPQSFGDLVGQEVVSKALCNAIELGKISHAYLFTGSRGTGKTSAARILAKSLNCKNGPTIKPCGECENCQNIAMGKALDVIEIDAASNNGVEDARDIIEKVQFVPVSGKYKIFIIDEVHMLTSAAFNALLKTIEEPPENLVFILATTESHKVIDTIVSRCQRFDFQKITTKDIENRLEYIAKEEKINISKEAISLIANRSAGGMRDAIALLDQASVLGLDGAEIGVGDILQIIGALSEDDLYSITEALADKNASELLLHLNKIIQKGNEPLLILKELIEYFRNLLLLKSANSLQEVRNLLNITDNYLPKVEAQAKKFEAIEIAQIIEKMVGYEYNLKNTTNQILIIEVILVSILYRQDILLLNTLEKRVSELEARLGEGNIARSPSIINTPSIKASEIAPKPLPTIEQTPSSKNPEIKPEEQEILSASVEVDAPSKDEAVSNANTQKKVTDDYKEKAWADLLGILAPSQRSFYLQMAKPVELSADKIIIAVRNEIWLKNIKESNKLKELQDATKQLYHKDIPIQLITFNDIKDTKKKSIELPKEAPIQKEPEVQRVSNIPTEDDLADFAEIKKEDTKQAELPQEGADLELLKNQPYKETVDMIVDLFQGKIIE